MTLELVFETHSITEDNEAGIATGWLPGKLSARGRDLALALGRRRANDGLAVVFTSDLARAIETADLALAGLAIPRLADWRLRECDYGELNGAPVSLLHPRRLDYIDKAHPGGESWRDAVNRTAMFLHDVVRLWDGRRILVIGHSAQRFALAHLLEGEPLERLLVADFGWREGWEYRLPTGWTPPARSP